ncbi:unnamed protein product [Schistocephalus solidus]|uniref:C2H2-type domain-containing protein n=1 Tax=Schistocephalus solidus TaxID=70667 RepID=A0A183T7S9_SCHSO|nr:unnamed protein product [Schistocephalus solidus]
MFVERLRRRHQCHVIASKLNLLTHFMPDLRPLARAAPGVGLTKTLLGKRLTFASQSRRVIGSSPIPSDSHSSIGVCDGDVIGSCRRTVRSTNHRRRRPIIRGSARTAHLKRLRLEVERRTAKAAAKATALAKLTHFSSQAIPTPAGTAVELNPVVSQNPSPSLHNSLITAYTPRSTGDQVVKGENEASESNLLPAGEDYHDSGLGSSECSLHSTFSSSTETSDSVMPAISKQLSSPKDDQETEVPEQGCAIFTLETMPRRRHSHPLISPHHAHPVFSVSNAPLSCSRESSSTVTSVASFGEPRKPTVHVFPDDLRRAKIARGGFPNSKTAQNCCTPRCIAEPLKPFLRFLSASEAHMLLSELHREHILRQQVDQLEQLRLAGSDNFQNVRLDGTKLDADSDSDDSVSSASSMATATADSQPARLAPRSDPQNTPPPTSSSLQQPAAVSRQPAGKTASAPTVFRRPRGRPPLLHRRGLPSRLENRTKAAVTAASSKQNSFDGYRRGRVTSRGVPSASSSARLSRGSGGRRASLSGPRLLPIWFFPVAAPRANVTTGGLNQVRLSGVVCASTPVATSDCLPPDISNTTATPSTSDGNSVLTCPHCDRTFTSHIGLRIHRKETGELVPGAPMQSRDRRLQCPHCPCVLTNRMGMIGHMRIHDSRIHHNADNTDTSCPPSAPAILTTTATPTTMNYIPPAYPDFCCPHCARNFNTRIGLVGHLRIHRTEAGELVPGAPTYS